MSERKPWAYVAMRDGKMRGVISADSEVKHIRRFYQSFAGADMKTVYGRAEYLALCESYEP